MQEDIKNLCSRLIVALEQLSNNQCDGKRQCNKKSQCDEDWSHISLYLQPEEVNELFVWSYKNGHWLS